MSAWGGVDRTATPTRLWFVTKPGFFDAIAWLGDRTGAKQRIDLPTDAVWQVYKDVLLVKTAYAVERGGPNLRARPASRPVVREVHGRRSRFRAPLRPRAAPFAGGFGWIGDRLALSILDNLASRFVLLRFVEGVWEREELDTLPQTGVVNLRRLDAEAEDSDGTVLVSAQDPITPPTLMLMNVAPSNAHPSPAVLKKSPAAFDVAGLLVTRHEAVSLDGELIPYTQTGPARETGDAPVHLTGYGGFAVSDLPTYRTAVGKLWFERGGTGVVANIRGGGEFGTRWHEAGRREGKRSAHDDFAAVAADLVRRGVTRPSRIAAEGGSNGGLLIANMLTRYPERFGALFCTIPLIDMRRYAKLLAGASWIAEYGDPDVPEDWAFLQHLSAYHTAEPGRPYPPILIATTRRDDRVHPGHARKMAAKLQVMGYAAHLYEPAAGGHGYGKDNAERAAFIALGFSFMREAIGWSA